MNDSQFAVTYYGLITNSTPLDSGIYNVQVNAMDKYYNFASDILTVTVSELVTTTTTSTTTTTTTTTTTEPTMLTSGTAPDPDVTPLILAVGGGTAALVLGIVIYQLMKGKKKK